MSQDSMVEVMDVISEVARAIHIIPSALRL
jgi:hypothetical protein